MTYNVLMGTLNPTHSRTHPARVRKSLVFKILVSAAD